jgi:sirohydrochlorin ferrochelatase
MAPRKVLVLLGHGSRRGSATDLGMQELACRLRRRLGDGPPVVLAFFEFLQPSLAGAVCDLAAQGVEQVVVLPYFLFDGKEITAEIPAALAELRAALPGLTIVQAENLGVDRRLIDCLVERVEGALRGTAQFQPILPLRGATGRLGVVLVNRGSRRRYDPGTRLEQLAALLVDRLGPDALVAPAQAENSPTTVAVAGRTLIAQGARRLVVAPYLHFPGKVLADNVIPDTQQLRREYPGVRVHLASTLCVDDRLVDIAHDRARAALAALDDPERTVL